MTKPNQIAYQWFQQALSLKGDEELYIPVSSNTEQKTLIKDIRRVIKEYSAVDKLVSSRIDVVGAIRSSKMWVKLYVKPTSPLVGFKKGADGNMERIILQDPKEKLRKVNLMLQDNVPSEQIIETLGLTEKEAESMLGYKEREE